MKLHAILYHSCATNAERKGKGGGGGVHGLPNYPWKNIFISTVFQTVFRKWHFTIRLNHRPPSGFDHAEPRPGAIFMRLVSCHGPPFSNPPSRASIRCNIHEVCLLSRPAIWDFCTQNLDQVQYSWEDGGFVIKANETGWIPTFLSYIIRSPLLGVCILRTTAY